MSLSTPEPAVARAPSTGTLEGRVAVVTGAGSGIGRAMLEAFAGVGARVVAADLSSQRLAALEKSDRLVTVSGDVGRKEDVERIVDTAVETWGQIDILCNNAGAPDRFLGVDECTDEEWERGLAIHLTGPFLASRRALPHMLAAGRGLILNTVSTAGISGANGGASYTASKHGLVGLSKNIAAMYGADGIRCVAICPGAVDTGAAKDMAAKRMAGELSARSEATRARKFAAFLRRAQAEEFGALALYLATGGADVLNGAVLTANSGYSAH